MSSRPLLAAMAAFLVSTSLLAQAVTIHVAPGGDDGADGTEERPLRTLQRAQAELRARRQPGQSADVVLHAGTYQLDAPLVFGPSDGGDDGGRVTWRGMGDAPPLLSGGLRLRGFAVAADGTWSLQLPADQPPGGIRELFVGGERRPRARTPNGGFLRIDKAVADRRSGFTFRAGDLPTLPPEQVAQAELLLLHDWSVTRVGVRSLDATTDTLLTTDPIGCAAPHFAIDNFEPHPRYRLENARALLDEPGEWCFDAAARTLTYLPLPGETLDSTEFIVPRATALLVVRGGDQPVRNLHFHNLRFEHCAWSIPAHGYAEGQANFHEPRDGDGGILRGRLPAALEFERAEDCSLTRLHLARLGGAGVSFGGRCVRCRLKDSWIENVSGNGVLIGETGDRAIDGKAWWQAAPEQATREIDITGCTIAHAGQQFFGAVGIWIGFARDCRVIGNHLHDLPYTGVSLGWVWNPTPTPIGGHVVEDNHIHHVMQLLSDGGGIYTLGRQPGTVLRQNRIHDVPLNLGRAQSNGMFLDEGTTDLVIEENHIWNVDASPLRFHRAGSNLVRGNLLVVRGEMPPVTYNATDAAVIRYDGNVVARESGKL
jgi:hypothetical protein